MRSKVFGVIFAGLTVSVSLGAAAPAPAVQQYYPGPGVYCGELQECAPIAYSRQIFSDPEFTNLIGEGSDECYQSGNQIYVTSPQLPAGFEVATPMYVCTDMGPYLPMGW